MLIAIPPVLFAPPWFNKWPTGGEASSDVLKEKNKRPVHALRFNWENMPPQSELGRRMVKHQSNCTLPLGDFRHRNEYGLGSDLHVWTQALCNGMERNIRVRTPPPWIWLDETACDTQTANYSSMLCYFPKSELACKDDVGATTNHSFDFYNSCDVILKEYDIPQIRAAGIEYLFQSVSPLVIQEAKRQLKLVFPNGVPTKLITVHIRWGDKKVEMKLVPIEEYIEGVHQLLQKRSSHRNTTAVSIYLATEDPKAVAEFKEKAPPNWTLYVDQYYFDMLEFRKKYDVYNQGPQTSIQTKGRAGLVALGSLLLAMEADDFVLTTGSNWSRLMNELRKSVLDPLCNGCTNMVDLRQGEW